MIDIKLIRENPDLVRENIRKKFQDAKLPLVDKVLELDKQNRTIKTEVQALLAKRNAAGKQIGGLMKQGKKEEAVIYAEDILKQNPMDEYMRAVLNLVPKGIPVIPFYAEGAEQMKQQEHLCKDSKVIMLTANAIQGAREQYLEMGFDDFLSKPILPDALEKMLRKYLEC